MGLVHFELEQKHIDLISRLNIQYMSGCEWGWLGADCKRPFGNGDLVGDMARILGIQPVETDDEETHWPKGTRDEMIRLFKTELSTALEVILEARSFEPGVYEKEEYGGTWELER